MLRRLPVLPTLFVLAAVATMVALGLWQLDRLDQKQAMMARYAAAQASGAAVAFPGTPETVDAALYHRSTLDCQSVAGFTSISGRNADGEAGLAHVADCRLGDGRPASVVVGWSRDPAAPAWRGGVVTGWVAPGPRLVADPAVAGLQANARPDPNDIPNNHLAYAVQWFFFAFVALVIYALAVRKRIAV